MSALSATQPQALRDDRDLVAAVRRGDDHAFGELYARYGRRIVSYVFGMVGDHGRAEDIAQEVFMSALTRMRATERPIVFKPWVYEIAKNACIDEFRRSRRKREVPLEPEDTVSDGDGKLVSLGLTPDAAAESRQQLDDLRSAFRGLSDNHHKILVLRELEGLSYAEIGHRLGMTRPVVESTLFRARRRLGHEYEEIASGQRCEQVRGVIDAGGTKAVRALGVRERRRLARHVSHCQPCRKHAWMAGVDASVLQPPTVVEKIAALLPIPAFLRLRRGGGQDDTAGTSAWHSFTPLRSVQALVQVADPTAPALSSVGDRAAAAVAAVVIAGGAVAGGVAVHSATQPSHPAARVAVVSSHVQSSRRTAGTTSQTSAGSPASTAARVASSGGGSSATSRTPTSATNPPASTSTVRTVASDNRPPNTLNVGNGRLPKLPTVGKPTVPQVQLPLQLPPVQLPPIQLPVPGVQLPNLPVQNILNGIPNPVQTVEGTLGLVGHLLHGN